MARSPRLQNQVEQTLILAEPIIGTLDHYLNGPANNRPPVPAPAACQAPPVGDGNWGNRSVEPGLADSPGSLVAELINP
jgi:hypothetical protein